MYKNVTVKYVLLLTYFFMAACSGVNNSLVQESQQTSIVQDELYHTIAYEDSIMFAAFNAHDLEKLKSSFSEDLEFYHDKGGLTNYQQTIENFRALFEKNITTGLRRDLVKGSLEVYPIKDYGAVATYLHKFCHVENGKDDCGTFKNVMIWQKKNGDWKVTRVISYDH